MSFSNAHTQSNSIDGIDNDNNYLGEYLNDSFDKNNFSYNQESNIPFLGNNSPQFGLNNIFEENNSDSHQKSHSQNKEVEKSPNQDNCNCNNPKSYINNPQKNSESNHTNKLNKKTKRNEPHTKYAENNIVRKFKIYLKNTLFEKINSEIQKIAIPKNIISINIDGKEYNVDKLLAINKSQIINTNVVENLKFLNTQLKDIFSVEISKKFKNYPFNYNKLVIEKLYQDNLTNVTCILDKTFLECLKYFRKDKDVFDNEEYSCLNGIEKNFEEIPKNFRKEGHDDKYIYMVIDLINNFEIIYENKMPRKK